MINRQGPRTSLNRSPFALGRGRAFAACAAISALSVSGASSAIATCATRAQASPVPQSPPPPTNRQPVVEQLHGETITDEYRWLESLESSDPAVKTWTDAQHAFTRSMLDKLPCRDHLRSQLQPLLEIPAIGIPRMRRGVLFFTERKGSENQPVLKSRPMGAGDSMVIIDPNAMGKNGLTSLDWWMPTHNGNKIAYGLSTGGSEMSVLRVRSVRELADYSDRIEGKVSFGGWFPDNMRFVYGVLRDPKDPYSREWRVHTLGVAVEHDIALLKQTSPSVIPYLAVSFDGDWFMGGYSRGWAANDLFVAPTFGYQTDGAMHPINIAQGMEARFEPIGFQEGQFFFLTTWQAPRGRVLSLSVADIRAGPVPKEGGNAVLQPSNDLLAKARTVIPEDPRRVIEDASLALGKLVITWQVDATGKVGTANLDGSGMEELALPGTVGINGASGPALGSVTTRTEENLHQGFFAYTSYNCPTTIYSTNWAKVSSPSRVWAKPEVPIDPSLVSVEQLFATSKDGTKVPYFLIHRTDIAPRGEGHPCVLYGYGGFNISLTPSFIASNWPWYTDGGVYAVANLRGGSEYGEEWHQAGMLGRKQNVFDDLYAVAQDLLARNWTTREQLAVMGGSNGGLLVGTAVTQRPDLFAAGVCGVPLLDMLRYDQFLLAKFWVPEYGDPANPADFAWLHAYSPYHNVEVGVKYPALLIRAGENDSRVHPLHARKMTARLQERAANDHSVDPVMLWVERDAGHGQGKPLSMRLDELVDEWSFIEWQTGLCTPKSAGTLAP